jgi:predicted secreted Zn-dependent protease
MLNLVTLLAAAAAAQAAPAAQLPALESMPGVKIQRYAVTGTTGDAIEKSMMAAMKAQPTTYGALFSWTANINAQQETVGNVCTIKSADAVLDANVYLPQLADESKVPADALKEWKTYESGLRQEAASNLSFVAQRLPLVQQSLVGKPCNQAGAIWTKGITDLAAQQRAFEAQIQKNKKKSRRAASDSDSMGALLHE